MKQLTIHVTQEDIDEGFQCTPYSCPVSLALEKMGMRSGANLLDKICFWDARGNWFTFNATKRLKAWTIRFDSTGEAKPATFRLRQ